MNAHVHPASASGAKREKLNAAPFDLVPFEELTAAYVRVAEFGAVKYAAWNWSQGLSRVQLIGSLLRHTFAYLRGEEKDADSGLNHTDHILWNAVSVVHNVHWHLEDGRRTEPYRAYKILGKDLGKVCPDPGSQALHAPSLNDEGSRYTLAQDGWPDPDYLGG